MLGTMKRNLHLLAAASLTVFGFTSCAQDAEQKTAGPTTDTSRIAWSSQNVGPGQGMGQFGVMPQNQYRR